MQIETLTRVGPRKGDGTRVPVILLDGDHNALSVARRLAAESVTVYAICAAASHVRFSRSAEYLGLAGGDAASWEAFLLGTESESYHGAILIACGDQGIELINRNHERLAAKFILEEFDPKLRRQLLDKRQTYEIAKGAGIPYPHYVEIEPDTDPEVVFETVRLPILLKPPYAPDFARAFGTKCFLLNDEDEARRAIDEVIRRRIRCLAMDFIPGGDEQLCSFTTYRTPEGEVLFRYTKHVIRRNPPGFGTGCYHEMDHNERAAEAGAAFFDRIGLVGFGNVEFKWDERDSQLKLIECNTRFTQANQLVEAAGLGLSRIVYSRLAGRPAQPGGSYQAGLRLWYPMHDFRAFLALRRRGELTATAWLRSLVHRKVWPAFSWRDPVPSFMVQTSRVLHLLRHGRAGKL